MCVGHNFFFQRDIKIFSALLFSEPDVMIGDMGEANVGESIKLFFNITISRHF